MELGNSEHKILRLHRVEETVIDNVVELHHNAELTIVELENVVELNSSRIEESEPAACINGVCLVAWKPKRPTAA